MPCCFKNNQQDKRSSKYSYFKECLGEDIIKQDKGDSIYVLDTSIPLNRERFGLLPPSLSRILGKCKWLCVMLLVI